MLSSPIKSIFTSFLMIIGFVSLAYGQPQQQGGDARPDFDPRRWLENLDKNKNGKLDPEELTGRAREFAAPKLKELGFDPDSSISIKSISKAVDKARASKNAPPPSVPGFGITTEMSTVPGFDIELGSALAGIGTLEERYDPRVLQRLQQTLDRYDKNKDGILDKREIAEAKWIYGDPTKNDLNKDGILTKTELAERYLAREKYEKDERKRRKVSCRTSTKIHRSGGNDGKRPTATRSVGWEIFGSNSTASWKMKAPVPVLVLHSVSGERTRRVTPRPEVILAVDQLLLPKDPQAGATPPANNDAFICTTPFGTNWRRKEFLAVSLTKTRMETVNFK